MTVPRLADPNRRQDSPARLAVRPPHLMRGIERLDHNDGPSSLGHARGNRHRLGRARCPTRSPSLNRSQRHMGGPVLAGTSQAIEGLRRCAILKLGKQTPIRDGPARKPLPAAPHRPGKDGGAGESPRNSECEP